MTYQDRAIIIISVAILLILGIFLAFIIQNDPTFRQRFDMDKPNVFQNFKL